MKRLLLCVLPLLAGACSVTMPLAVVGARGDILVGETVASLAAGTFRATNSKFSCSGGYNSLSTASTIAFSVRCTDGRTGGGTATRDNTGLAGAGTLTLSDGEVAQFVFGPAARAYQPKVAPIPPPQLGPTPTPPATPAATRPNGALPPVVYEFEEAHRNCRGGFGDDPQTHIACALRERLAPSVKAAGWCWGGSAVGATMHWLPCVDEDRRVRRARYDVAFRRYLDCVSARAVALALRSTEPARVVAAAARGLCSDLLIVVADTFEAAGLGRFWGGASTELAIGAENIAVTSVVAERARAVAPPQPTPPTPPAPAPVKRPAKPEERDA